MALTRADAYADALLLLRHGRLFFDVLPIRCRYATRHDAAMLLTPIMLMPMPLHIQRAERHASAPRRAMLPRCHDVLIDVAVC